MDAVALARFQFAFTVGYHFFFVPLSIGLGLIVVLFQRRYYKSKSAADLAMADLWVKIFAATFTIGVATGITMEFAFGTNWASYSRFGGDIFGAPLAAAAQPAVLCACARRPYGGRPGARIRAPRPS
jgi:cytochrome d ubiquinol oxidase subunit I